jgi:hypothetical protein
LTYKNASARTWWRLYSAVQGLLLWEVRVAANDAALGDARVTGSLVRSRPVATRTKLTVPRIDSRNPPCHICQAGEREALEKLVFTKDPKQLRRHSLFSLSVKGASGDGVRSHERCVSPLSLRESLLIRFGVAAQDRLRGHKRRNPPRPGNLREIRHLAWPVQNVFASCAFS